MNPIYGIFNQSYIEQQNRQYQKHISQIIEIQKSTNALKDFLDSSDNILPEYQQIANAEFCAVLFNYFKRHNLI